MVKLILIELHSVLKKIKPTWVLFVIFKEKKMLRFFFISLSFFVFVPNLLCNPSLIKQTLNGPIKGIELTSSLGQKYLAFKGVRYAMPPITGFDPFTGEKVDRRFKVSF